jgi:high affinity Mn2+ porin
MAANSTVRVRSRGRLCALASCLMATSSLIAGRAARANDQPAADAQATLAPESFAVHGQFTYVEQETSDFNAPYAGPNSLSPDSGRETTDATLYLGRALWSGAEVWINGEVDQGFGLDDTLGVAGFTSAEAYKVGKNQPYLRLPRLFVRDTFSLDGDSESVESAANQLAGSRSANRWVVTVGKFSVGDIFDVNPYAHDPRGDFLNWTAVDAGSFDYAADAWGYTVGASAEWYQGPWTLRGGAFDLSNIPNSVHLDPGFHEFQLIAEFEHRQRVAGHPGNVMVTLFDSRGRMGLLDQAVALAEATNTPVNIAAVRQYRSRLGADVNLSQELTADLGLFARVGKAAGNVEAYEFTDVDRSISGGLSLKGTSWSRASDTVGLAFIDNGISAEREQYLNAGGLGILVGDGKLPHPGPEEILETYYSAAVLPHCALTFDYQWIDHPAYNRDRGPVSVFAVRFHAQF